MRARKRLEAASTLPEDARLAPFAKFLLQTTKLYAESVAHTSLGVRPRRNPREAPTRNSTLKACHITDMQTGHQPRLLLLPCSPPVCNRYILGHRRSAEKAT